MEIRGGHIRPPPSRHPCQQRTKTPPPSIWVLWIATKGLYKHTIKHTTFTLVVNEFGIYMTSLTDLNHLHQALNAKYLITINISGSLYLGMMLKWNYKQGHVNISIPGYITRTLARFHVQLPTCPQYSPHISSTIQYRIKTQLTKPFNTTTPWCCRYSCSKVACWYTPLIYMNHQQHYPCRTEHNWVTSSHCHAKNGSSCDPITPLHWNSPRPHNTVSYKQHGVVCT